MQKGLTDIHTHSFYSFDSETPLEEMLSSAYEKGVVFYGIAEHFDYDVYFLTEWQDKRRIDLERYFHGARHLQEDYEGAMHVLVGAEFGYSDAENTKNAYLEIAQKYRPDFIVNSLHTLNGVDYFSHAPFYTTDEKGARVLRDRVEVFREYFAYIRRSLDAPYPYDIVGHIGYVTRYAPYENREMRLADYQAEIDDILLTIIKKDKILEVNSSNKDGLCLPTAEIIKRYYELGGRKISYASDTHNSVRIADKREEVVAFLKEVGFTYITVPCKGEHIKVEI
jgi:histidinol-phosphatase (PHP family)